MQRPMQFCAILLGIAFCAAPTLGCRSVCATDECESGPLGQRQPLAGRLSIWKDRCANHFADEPVAAPHSRFHPVPTRPVFSPPSAEELAALFTPPEASKGQVDAKELEEQDAATMPSVRGPLDDRAITPDVLDGDVLDGDAFDGDAQDRDVPDGEAIEAETPAETLPPPEELDGAEPTRTARRVGLRLEVPSQEGGKAGEKREVVDARNVDAPSPGGSPIDVEDADSPLLWRAVRTPVGSLRAVPADSVGDVYFP